MWEKAGGRGMRTKKTKNIKRLRYLRQHVNMPAVSQMEQDWDNYVQMLKEEQNKSRRKRGPTVRWDIDYDNLKKRENDKKRVSV